MSKLKITILLVMLFNVLLTKGQVFPKPIVKQVNEYQRYWHLENVEITDNETILIIELYSHDLNESKERIKEIRNGNNYLVHKELIFYGENTTEAYSLKDDITGKIYKQIKSRKSNMPKNDNSKQITLMYGDKFTLKMAFEKLDSNCKSVSLYRRGYPTFSQVKLFQGNDYNEYLAQEKQKADEQERKEIARQKQYAENEKKERERQELIKSQIESGTFTGNHYYSYSDFKYTGSFVNGIPNGQGKWEKPDGSWYAGQFKNGVENGIGTLRQTSGLRYTGNFTDGVPNGNFKIEQWTLMGLSRNEWQAEYQNGKLVSSAQTNDGMDKLFSGGSSSYSNNTNQNNSNGKSNSQTPTEYKIPEVKKIEFEQTKSSFVMGESEKYFVTYKDGVTGYLFYSKKYQQWYINNSTTDFGYDTKDNALAALYEYKDKGSIRKIGRKN